jgi:tripartite-type tricarboxylate transporter receptor subunit TctC
MRARPRLSMLASGLVVVAALLASAAPAMAQQLPPRPVRIVVPFTSSGFPDRIARVIAGEMSETHPQRVYVENKPGAGGMIGSAEVARAAPDGTTLLMSTMPTLVLAPLINPRHDFRPVEDFSHIAYIGGPPNAFVVASTSKIQSFGDLLRVARDTSQNYGTAGVGTVGHLTAVYVAQKANLKLTHIPYNGPMLGDIISGVVDIGSLTASTVMGNIDGGTLRALVVGTDKRLANYPQVPTFKELDFDISPIAWMAISGPPGMSRELQTALNKQITDILAQLKMKEILQKELIEPIAMSPQDVIAFIKRQIESWTPIVESVGLRK